MPVTTIGFGSGGTSSYYQGGPWANLYSGSGSSPLSYSGQGLENPTTPNYSSLLSQSRLPSQPSAGVAGLPGTASGPSNTQSQLPSWWTSRVPNLPGKTAPPGFVPGTRSDLTWLLQQARPPDPAELFKAWFKGPQGPMYNTAMSATPEQTRGMVQNVPGTTDASGRPVTNVPDWLKWDIVQGYGSQGAYAPGGPLAAGGLYGPPAPTPTSGQQLTPQQQATAVNAMQSAPLSSVSSVSPAGTTYGTIGTNPQMMEYNPQSGMGAVVTPSTPLQVYSNNPLPTMTQAGVNQSLLSGSKNPGWWARTLAAQGKLTPPNP